MEKWSPNVDFAPRNVKVKNRGMKKRKKKRKKKESETEREREGGLLQTFFDVGGRFPLSSGGH